MRSFPRKDPALSAGSASRPPLRVRVPLTRQAILIHHLLVQNPDNIPQGADPVDRTLFLRRITEEALSMTRCVCVHWRDVGVNRSKRLFVSWHASSGELTPGFCVRFGTPKRSSVCVGNACTSEYSYSPRGSTVQSLKP